MAGLLYKNDWDEVKSQFRSFWKMENSNRPVFNMDLFNYEYWKISKDAFQSTEEQWLDTEKIILRDERIIKNSSFIADSFPGVSPSLGPGNLGVYLGSKPVFERNTVWYEPCFDDIEKATINFDKTSELWRWTIDYINKAIERGRGKYLTLIPDLIENVDTIAALVGTEPLLYYMMDCPEEIHRLQKQLLPVWFEVYEEIYQLVKDDEDGSAFIAFGLWAPGRMAKLQCDFSAMISSNMFNEFVMPYLKEQSDRIEYTLYHLDGPNAIQHLDSLLSINSLKAIQWQPGAGAPDGGDPCWDSLYRRILDAGKCIQACVLAEKVEGFVKRIGKKGVFIYTCPKDEKQAYEIVNKSYNW